MKKKLLAILIAYMLMITSTMILIEPENLGVKADNGGSGNGNDVGINLSYIYTKAQNLSQIVIHYPKGRSFGTDGELQARDYIKNWMNENGLYNVHTEPITNAYDYLHPENGVPINNKLEPLLENLTVNNTKLNQSEFYIDPRWNFTMFPRVTSFLFPKSKLTTTFQHNNSILKQRPSRHIAVDQVLYWCMSDLKNCVDNGTIFDFDSFANYTLGKFAEYFNFSWYDMINDPLHTIIVNNSQYIEYFNQSVLATEDDFLYIDENPLYNPNPSSDFIPPCWFTWLFPDPLNPVRLFYP